MNTIYAKDKSKSASTRRRGGGRGHGKDRRGVGYLDARELVERYEGFVWAEGVTMLFQS